MRDRLLAARTTLSLALLSLTMVGLGGSATAQSADFQLIGHPDLAVQSMTKKQVSDIFLKKTSRIDGVELHAVDLTADLPVREAFSQTVHGRDVSAVKSFWQRQIFSGRSAPPPERPSETEVLDFVRKTPGAIGYVAKTTDTRGVQILELED